MPGVVKSFNAAKMTATVQLAILARVRAADKKGSVSWVKIPLLTDCPVIFPSGGGFTLTFPIDPGDECLVSFSARCIDAWWQNGGEDNQQVDLRMHDLSDGFVTVGPRSQKRLLSPAPSASDAVLRKDDNTVRIVLKASTIEIVAPTQVSVVAPAIILDGNVTVTGDLQVDGTVHADVDVIADDVSGKTHVHVKGPGASTDPPTPM